MEYAMIGIGSRGDEKNGTCRIDSQYKRNVSNALKEGIEAGVYFVSRATTVEEAKEEAQFVIKNLKNYDITWPVALDTTEAADGKETRASGLTSAERTACAKAFMEEIGAAGYTPVWYANDDWSVLKLNMGERTMICGMCRRIQRMRIRITIPCGSISRIWKSRESTRR